MKIYFDMDGVLANFGKEKNGVERFKTENYFFYNLKPIKKNIKLVKRLLKNGFDVNILSASPNANADADKIIWLKKYLPELKRKNIFLCRNNQSKADFIGNVKNSILIDDYTLNLINWLNKGGKVLKFVNKYDSKKGKHNKHKIPFTKNIKISHLEIN